MISFNLKFSDLDSEAKTRLAQGAFLGEDSDTDFCVSDGFLFVRVFDDSLGYIFRYPIALSDAQSERAALDKISAYCLKENIPEIIFEAEAAKLPLLLTNVRHAELHAMDGGFFIVEIKTELSLLESDIDFEYEGLSLSLPSQKYAKDYQRLVSDKAHNEFYGYELTDDNPDITPSDMIAELLREYGSRRSLTLFAAHKGKFVGEAVLYDFDGRGSAEISFRVGKNMTHRGFGKKILSSLLNIAENFGLLSLRARVHKDNEISLSLIKSQGFTEVCTENSVIHFKREL